MRDPPTGFPLYLSKRQPRVVTADVWAYLTHAARDRLPRGDAIQVAAFIDQAFEFFEAARNPRTGSRPLLYYYSFLNLAKVLLLMRRVAIAVAPRHGIRDPKENIKTRLQLEGQRVVLEARRPDHSELFPEIVAALGGRANRRRIVRILSLFRQIPGVHRTFCRVTGETPAFLPVKEFKLLSHHGMVFARVIAARRDADVRSTLEGLRGRRRFTGVLDQVRPGEDDELWFETQPVAGARNARDRALRRLAERLGSVGVWSILTRPGYRYYLATIPPSEMLPPLASIYAVMFYLGSITRYKPYDFDRIISQRFAWLVSEFLRTQPNQFLYCLASHVAGVDVVPPFASIE